MLVAQKDIITNITGIIMPKSIDILENELGGAFTILKSSHFSKEQHYGFLASVIPKDKYWIVISNPAWVYAAPANPGAYAATTHVAGVSAAQHEQILTQHKEEQMSYANYLGSQEAGKELLLYGVGNDALTPFKKQYINSSDATIHSMILHLQEKTAIKMTTLQKFEYKSKGYAKQWDPTTSISAYFTGLEKFCTSLADRGISTSIEEMMMAVGARMWESEMFTEDQMVTWENKPAAQQMWQLLQDYFTEKWLECHQYLQAMAKHSQFKGAALAAQEQAAAEDEGKVMAMMFALLQEKHKILMEAIATASQKVMDAMMERMNALVSTGHGKPVDKVNTPPATGNVSNGTVGKKRNKRKCPHCGKHVLHKLADCYKLEANTSKRWTGWKSIKDTNKASA